MTTTLEVGTILLAEHPAIKNLLGLDSESSPGNWSVVKALDGVALDRKIHAAGWNFFFMAAEVKVRFFGALGTTNISNGLRRILAKVRHENFNGLEITGIAARRFLGVPYVTLSAHSRHIQQSCQLDGAEARHTSQVTAESSKKLG